MTRIVILQSIWEGIEALRRGLGTAGQVHRSDVLFICALEEIKYILINPVHQSGAFKHARHILLLSSAGSAKLDAHEAW